jgi:hypothetical protein
MAVMYATNGWPTEMPNLCNRQSSGQCDKTIKGKKNFFERLSISINQTNATVDEQPLFLVPRSLVDIQITDHQNDAYQNV